MVQVQIDLKMISLKEKWHKKLVGEKEDNKISYQDDGFDVAITWEPEKIVLVKSSNSHKITLCLEKDKSFCLYHDYGTNFELTLKITDEIFTYGHNYVNMRYVVEETNEVIYELSYEVME